MERKNTKCVSGRDREATENRLLEAVGQVVCRQGFEQVGVNAVAAEAGVSKVLIYRYFGSVEGLLAAYIRQHDFWINFPLELPVREECPAFLKQMMRQQIARLCSNPTLRRLSRWELSSDNKLVVALRAQREKAGIELVEGIARVVGRPVDEIAAPAAILSTSIAYLAMLGEFCPYYNGIRLDEDAGWEQIGRGMDAIIDRFFEDMPSV